MAVEIRIPRLGWTMEEGIFRGWLKEDGARIKSGDPIFVLESEKTAQEIESTDEGVLKIDPVGPTDGSIVFVGDLIGYLLAEGEQVKFQDVSMEPEDHLDGVPPTAASGQPVEVPQPRVGRTDPHSHIAEVSRGGLTISPRAARAAAALGVDWTKIRGTGRTGRIRERDVIAAASGLISRRDT